MISFEKIVYLILVYVTNILNGCFRLTLALQRLRALNNAAGPYIFSSIFRVGSFYSQKMPIKILLFYICYLSFQLYLNNQALSVLDIDCFFNLEITWFLFRNDDICFCKIRFSIIGLIMYFYWRRESLALVY